MKNHPECALSLLGSISNRHGGIRFLKIEENRLLLVEHTSPARYICLSHCWGSGEGIIRTTTSNLHAHLEGGIPLTTLPATFRDAVEVCRSLKILYLWLDSLCIVQDSDEDWREQSAKMADIYANASITIAASASENATRGLFRVTDPKYLGGPLPGHTGVYVRLETEAGEETWPLLRRAWVFQELVLSPRLVHFGTNEVVWQCQRIVERESRQLPPNTSFSHSTRYLQKIIDTKRLLQSEHADLTHVWHGVVMSYSRGWLTYSKNRLPAIAAMARIMQSLRPNDVYLAGLWQSNLYLDLLWHCWHGSAEHSGDIPTAIERRITVGVPT